MSYPEETTAYRWLSGPYHIDDGCPRGRAIPPELRIQGTGGATLCETCALRLEARERSVTLVEEGEQSA